MKAHLFGKYMGSHTRCGHGVSRVHRTADVTSSWSPVGMAVSFRILKGMVDPWTR